MFIKHLIKDIFHLFYPHTCTGCGSDLIYNDQLLCTRCLSDLPVTRFAFYENNLIEKIFRGRLALQAAHSHFYFAKNELIQHLIHQLKYKGNIDIGIYLGELTGDTLLESGRFSNIDLLIPLPLFSAKEIMRGYNQAEIICRGISAVTQIPILKNNVIRRKSTETQTKKHRAERWQNVEGSFLVSDPACLNNRHILLVDDVVTTGATLEACGRSILDIEGTTLSIACLAHASK